MTTPTLIDGRALLSRLKNEKHQLELLRDGMRGDNAHRPSVCDRVMQLEVVIGWVEDALRDGWEVLP